MITYELKTHFKCIIYFTLSAIDIAKSPVKALIHIRLRFGISRIDKGFDHLIAFADIVSIRICCCLQLFSLLANVADVKSLVIHPATTTHSQLTDEELADQGIKQNTIRLSIGTEHIDDIIEDLERGFAALK